MAPGDAPAEHLKVIGSGACKMLRFYTMKRWKGFDYKLRECVNALPPQDGIKKQSFAVRLRDRLKQPWSPSFYPPALPKTQIFY